MKRKIAYLLAFVLMVLSLNSSAQSNSNESTGICHEYIPHKNDAVNPCITPEQYSILEQRIRENSKPYIHDASSQQRATQVSLGWPLQEAPGFTDCSYYFFAAYVDQDTNATTYKDYNCGTDTYDGHRGTDIAIEPFPFYKMDNEQVQVVAAAAGIINDKHDGEFDRECVGSGSNLTANYIILSHADGSYTLYWHMKKNSLTSKTIGQSVAAGELLGVVGSSGSSSGPHLHFEVWSGSTSNTLIDPFTGACNHLNASTWWASQKAYLEPAPVKASVHTTDITFPACGVTEVPNESTSYTIPFQGAGLSPGYAKFYVFLRNQTSGTTINMSILNPNTSVYSSWSYNSNNNYNFSYLNYSKLLPTTQGTYTFNATYNGITCTQRFDIINPTGITEREGNADGIRIYPNPFNASTIIQSDKELMNGEMTIFNIYGQIVKTIKNISGHEIKLSRDDLKNGVYFIRLMQGNTVIYPYKPIIIQS